MSSLHQLWGYFAAALSGMVGLWGVAIPRRNPAPRSFIWAVGAAMVAMLIQILLGVILYSGGKNPGNQHVFYGVVIAVTLSFAYIYRGQFRKRPTLYLGLLLLFTMGLSIRGILTFGNNF